MHPLQLTLDALGHVRSASRVALAYVRQHAILSAVGAVVLVSAGWGAAGLFSSAAPVRYVLGTAKVGTIVSAVSVSGQVSAKQSIDIKPKVSGSITWVGVVAGQTVRAGQALATIDSTTARQALDAAQRQLAADKLSFQKSQAQAPIDYQNDVTALATAKENLSTDYNTTYNDLTGMYLDFPAVLVQAQNTLYGYDFDVKKAQWNIDFLYSIFTNKTRAELVNVDTFRGAAQSDYSLARTSYNQAVDTYKITPRAANAVAIDSLLTQSIAMATNVAQGLQSELNFLGAASDLAQASSIGLPSSFSTVQSATRQSLAAANSDLSTLLADKKMLDSAKQAITAAQQTITLDQVGNPEGSNPITLQISANSIAKEEQDIANQEANLADYTVVAPFSGVVASVSAMAGDIAGSGAIATIISNNQVATLSLNEVDAAKVKVGQRATLTFDALDSLTLTGTVAQIDSVGAVSQGVVSYAVTIAFDTQNTQVKPGMTVNASIQIDVARDALVVPQSAVKAQNGQSYVLVFDPAIDAATAVAAGTQGVIDSAPPTMTQVTTGLSDDTSVQILSGLSEGQQIVVSTRSGTSASAASVTRSGTTSAARGATFGGGGAVLRGF